MKFVALEALRFAGMVAFFAVPLVALHLFNEADKDAEIYPHSGSCPDSPSCYADMEGGVK